MLSPWWWIKRLALLLVIGYFALSAYVVWSTAHANDINQRVDAIVVLGAAQYNGKPSPVLQRRLDHAIELYRARRRVLVVVTGGRQEGDRLTEASASANYLIKNGVPDSRIRREVQGRNTYQSLAAAARFLKKANATDVLLVTDGYHSARVKGISREVGLRAYVSPANANVPKERLVKETLAVGLGELIGYRRLTQLLE